MRIGTSGKGFTLIELLVVIAIIAVLAAILFPVFTAAKLKGQQANCAGNMKQLGVAAQAYFGDYGDYGGIISAGPEGTPWYNNYHNPWIGDKGENPAQYSPIFKYCRSVNILICPAWKGKVRLTEDNRERFDPPLAPGTKRQPAWTYTFVQSWGQIRPDTVRHPAKKAMWVEENLDPSVQHPSNVDAGVQINDMSFFGSDITASMHTGVGNTTFLDGHVGILKGRLECSTARWVDSGILIFAIDKDGN